MMLKAVLLAPLICLSAAAEPVIVNPSFEQVAENGQPLGWKAWSTLGDEAAKGCTTVEVGDAPDGKRVGQLAPAAPQIAILSQNLQGLVPGQWYEVSGMIRCNGAVGHGCRLAVEYWRGSVAYGGVDSESLVGDVAWQKAVVRFAAPSTAYRVQLDFIFSGQSGTGWMDDLAIKAIAPPAPDISGRRVLDGPFWGVFTCFARWFHKYARDMQEAGVVWHRMGLGATAPDLQKLAAETGIVFACCIDGMPGARDANDPCYPVTHWGDYLGFIGPFIEKPAPQVRIWEIFNEPNLVASWTLPGYSNLLNRAAKAIKATQTGILVGTGGLGLPFPGYVEALLKRDQEKLIDVVLIHPYAVDEGLDSQLTAVSEACVRTGRPDIAVAINETGWPTWDPATGYQDYSQFVSEAEQARNIVKLHIQSQAHRLSFVTYLGWNDVDEKTDQAHNMGLVRLDGSPKPSWRAYRFMTATIGDRRVEQWSCGKEGTRVYRFSGEKPLWAVWNALEDTKVVVDTGDVDVFPCDLYGTKLAVTPVRGKVEVKVGEAPVYLVPVEP
ncbi:MAG: hypothetical protein GXY33_08140 [Phycisphaerae bacterium]|nr:hypothetical protein [Phycisphaerae bacterium]